MPSVSLTRPRSIDCAAGNVLDQAEVDRLRGKERPQLPAEGILAEPPDQGGQHALLGRRDRLVGALAAGKVQHVLAGDGLADSWMALGSRHHIHVDAAGDEHPPHIYSQKSLPPGTPRA